MDNKFLTVYAGDETITVKDFSVSYNYMSDKLLTFNLSYPKEMVPDFTKEWYCYFDDIKFIAQSQDPSSKKDNSGLYEFTMIFEPEYERQLKNVEFINLVNENDLNRALHDYVFAFAGTIYEFSERFRLNLKYYYPDMTIDINPEYDFSELASTVSVDSTSLWDALSFFYDIYGAQWHVVYSGGAANIKIGYDGPHISHVFQYRNGVKGITKSNSTDDIVTMLRFSGTSDNIPYNYLQNRYSESLKDPDGADEFVYGVRNLLGSSARLSVRGWNDAKAGKSVSSADEAYLWGYNRYKNGEHFDVMNYVVSPNIEKYGVRVRTMEDIDVTKPSIQGKYKDGLGRIDEVVDVEKILVDVPPGDPWTITGNTERSGTITKGRQSSAEEPPVVVESNIFIVAKDVLSPCEATSYRNFTISGFNRISGTVTVELHRRAYEGYYPVAFETSQITNGYARIHMNLAQVLAGTYKVFYTINITSYESSSVVERGTLKYDFGQIGRAHV